LPDALSRFASLQSGETDIVWDDEYDADNIQKAQKDPKLTVHTYAGSGAQVYVFNTKVAPFDRRSGSGPSRTLITPFQARS
jgi:peptide/nickel transport system substrate-binding protein